MNCGDIPGLRLMAVGVATMLHVSRGVATCDPPTHCACTVAYFITYIILWFRFNKLQEHARTRKLDTRGKFPLHDINNTCMHDTQSPLLIKLFAVTFITFPMNRNLFLIQTYAGHMVPWLVSCALYHFVVKFFEQSAMAVYTVTWQPLRRSWEEFRSTLWKWFHDPFCQAHGEMPSHLFLVKACCLGISSAADFSGESQGEQSAIWRSMLLLHWQLLNS